MVDGNYVEWGSMQKRWPLIRNRIAVTSNSMPADFLSVMVHVTNIFASRALGIPADDSQARRFQEPTPELLRRLSDGTGIPVELLEQMTLLRIWNRLMDEMRQYAETPEGRAELEGFTNRRLSQNS